MRGYRMIARETGDQLGEGPLWLADRGRLVWVDIFGKRLWSLDPATDAVRSWDMPERIGWVVPRAGRDDFLAGFKSGVAVLSLAPFGITPLHAPERDRPHNRLNDAKVDAEGRLWFGSKDDRDEAATGALYRLEGHGPPVRVDDGYRVANGPAFGADGRTLYHTDSGLGLVYRFALAADGMLSDRTVHIRFEAGWGAPDGMTVDADGCLWIAHWGGGRVSRFDPDGRLMRHVALPATNITSCTFGGPALDRLFVTSAAAGTEGEAAAGALFEVDVGVRGVPSAAFAG